MVTNRVVLVHGMGRHGANWSKPWQDGFAAAAKRFAPYADGARSLATDVEFQEIGYDAVFEGYRARWRDLGQALMDQDLPDAVRPVFEELAVQGAGSLPELAWTHLLDVVLWYGLDEAREHVIAHVVDQIVDRLNAAVQQGSRLHIVAHSLGTSVVHDSLLCLTDPKYAKGRLDPAAGGMRWDSLVTFANVSRLLQARRSPSDVLPVGAFDPTSSRVHAGTGGLLAVCVDVHHRLDPFTFVRPFELAKRAGHRHFILSRYGELAAIHAVETVFASPDVAAACLRLWTGDDELGASAEIAAADAAYRQVMAKTDEAFQTVRRTLAGNGGRSLAEVVKALAVVIRELQSLKGGV